MQRLVDVLGRVAKEASRETTRLLLAGRLAAALARREISAGQVLEMIWRLPLRQEHDVEWDSLTELVYQLDHMNELVSEGFATVDDVAEEVRVALMPYQRFDWSAA